MNAHRPESQPKHPTGDSIAKTIENRDAVRNELPYADLSKDLAEAHARRPGLWQQDLDKVNTALHNKGMLPGLDIIGTSGQDLVTRNKEGKTILVDASGHSRQHVVEGGGLCKKFGDSGRTGEMNSDGSGKYTIQKHDNAWNVSRDILKAQGEDKPSANHIANFIKELQRFNGVSDLGKLHPGQEIKIPPRVVAGDKTEFTRDRAADQIKGMNDKVEESAASYNAAIEKFGTGMGYFKHLDQASIKEALANGNPTSTERKSLEFMQKNYDQMKFEQGTFSVAAPGIYSDQIAQWKAAELKKIDDARVAYDR